VKSLKGSEVPSVFVDENSDGNIFYAASESYVYKFDIRCSLQEDVHCFKDNTDEINFITMNDKGFFGIV